MKTPSLRRLDGHYIAMQMGFWAMYAAVCAYQAALLQERGFTNSQAGMVIAVRCLAGIVCQPLLGGLADRRPDIPLRRIVGLSLAVSLGAGICLLLFPEMGLGGTLAVFAVLGALEISSYPLMDAMAIQFINAGMPIRYSLGRGLGSLAYAVVCVFLGLQVRHLGVETTLVTHAGLMALEIILVVTYPLFPAEAGTALKAEKPRSIPALLKYSPRFTLTLAGVLCGLTAVMPLSNFLVNIVESRGGESADLGVALFLMAGFELPAAVFFPKLMRRLGSRRILLLSMVFMLGKGAALLAARNLAGVLLAQPLQMLGYGLFTPASVYFVNESVPPADRVRGQTVMMVASNGLGGMLGSLLAGRLLDLGGVTMMLCFCMASGAAAVVLCALAGTLNSGDFDTSQIRNGVV